MSLSNKNYLKIGQASKALGVSIDTLRRWEKAGKITAIRTPGGTRLYSLSQLKKVNPASFETYQTSSLSTEELLKRTSEETLDARDWKIDEEVRNPSSNLQHPTSLLTKFLISTALVLTFTLLVTSWITASYLTHPEETKQFFKNNVASGLLSPFHLLAEETVMVISPKKARELGFNLPKEPPTSSFQSLASNPNVLAVTTTTPFLEVNADTQINGSLFVRDQINNLSLEGTPSASTITIASGGTTLTVSDSAEIDQDVSTLSSPTFNVLTLTGNQINNLTLPAGTTTLVGTDTTQTLTNKSLSGSANTFTNIPNSALVNPHVTVTAGTNLTGGGKVVLGESITISAKSSPSFSGVVLISDGTAAAPGLAFTDDTDTGLYRIDANRIGLITAGSATSGITINASGNVGVGVIAPSSTLHVVGTALVSGATTLSSTLAVTGTTTLSSTLDVTGNTTVDTNTFFVDASNNRVGIGTTTPGSTLGINGNVGIGVSYSTLVTPSNGLAVEGNVGIGTTSPLGQLDVSNAFYTDTGTISIRPVNSTNEGGQINLNSPSSTYPGNIGIDSFQGLLRFLQTNVSPGAVIEWDLTYGNAIFRLGASGSVNAGTITGFSTINAAGSTNLNLNTVTSGNILLSPAGGGNVGIGVTTPISKLGVGGNVNIGALYGWKAGPTNGLAVEGNVGIGTTSPTTKLFVVGQTTVTDKILPSIGSVDVGSSAMRFGTGYFDTVDASNLAGVVTGSGTDNVSWTINQDNTGADVDMSLAFERGTETPNAVLGWDSTNDEFDLNSQLHITGTITSTNGIILDGFTSDLTTGTNEHLSLMPNGTGNVGIGSTNPGAKLHVNGNAVIGYGEGIAGPSSGLAVSGNVGVGTTSPLQALHVVGQCVAKGTRIRRRRKGTEDEWEEVPVEDIKPDDEILSLNDATGAWEWHKVEKTMDMGIQEVFRLETEGGKWIETTSNHPYLVRESSTFRRLFVESNIDQKSHNQEQSITNTKFYSEVGKINHPWLPLFLNLKATDMDTILNPTVYVNNTSFEPTSLSEINGVAIANATQPAAKLTSSSDNIIKNTGSSFINNTLPHQSKWIKVSKLKVGMEIATVDGWEKIASITNAGRVQTYDLQIENTHNFVGNDIVAHNTYITGNVGLGVTTPGATLSINGNSVIGYSGVNIAGPSSGLAVSGNVGIGTTTANSTLSVAGSAHIGSIRQGIAAPTNGLFVDGNVGIGATTSSNLLDVWGNARITGTLSVDAQGTLGSVLVGFPSSATAPTSGLGVSGNVGVGTTSPLQALHVVGQCVAKGTRIRRRRKGTEDEWEEVPVEDIKPDDEILSLNDATGAWEWHKVEKTMDMGIQEVFRLETETGKWIETTSNHPYLVREELFEENQNSQQDSYGNQSKSNTGFNINIFNIYSSTFSALHNLLLNITPTNNARIPNSTLIVNTQGLNLGLLETKGTTKAAPNQPADRLIKRSDNAISQILSIPLTLPYKGKWIKISLLKIGQYIATGDGWEKITSIKSKGRKQTYDLQIENTHNFVGGHYINRKTGKALTESQEEAYFKYLAQKQHQKTASNEAVSSGLTRFANTNEPTLRIDTNIPQEDPDVKSQKGVDPTGIEPVRPTFLESAPEPGGPTQDSLSQILGEDVNENDIVYGGIVAHNTYITGNVGLGVTTPGSTLSINGNSVIGYSGVNIAGPSSGLAVSGNVGVGITTANSTLSVAGNAHIGGIRQGIAAPSNGLFVDGNVGIGATTSSNILDVWGNARITGTLTVDSTSTFGGNLTLSGNLLPNADDTYDLGSNTLRWRDLYLGPATMHIGTSTSDEYSLSYDTTNNRLGFNVNDSGPAEIVFDSNGNLGIGTTAPTGILHVAPIAASSGAGAPITLTAQQGAATSGGGAITLTTGAGGSTSGGSGTLTLASGNITTSGTVGSINLTVGSGSGSEVTAGSMTFTSGNATGSNRAGGGFTFNAGSAGNTTGTGGGFIVSAGTGGGGANNGSVMGTGGAISLTAGTGGGSGGGTGSIGGTGGALTLTAGAGGTGGGSSGFSGGTGGNLILVSGNAGTLGNANSGNAILRTGTLTGSGTAGTILFQTNGANTRMAVHGGGNVGVGTSVPGSLFVVTGGNLGIGVSATGAALQVNDGGIFWASTTALTPPTNGLAVQGNIGIGTTTANNKLSVVGGVNISNNYQSISAPTSGLFVEGNVGIGATTSSNLLDVWGNTRITGTLTVDSTSTFGGNLTLSGNLLPNADDTYDLGSNTARWDELFLGPSTLHIGTSTSDEYTLSYDTTNNRLGFNVNGSGPSEIVFDSSGNVGIGNTGPSQLFQINPSGSSAFVVTSGGNVGIGFTSPDRLLQTASDINIVGSNASLLGAAGTQFAITGSSATGTSKKLVLGIDTTDNYGVIQAGNTDGTNYTLALNPAGGNVGIGTTSPNATLDVRGAIQAGVSGTEGITNLNSGSNAILIQNSAGLDFFYVQPANSVSIFPNGNVGIGDQTPDALLNVENANTGAGPNQVIIETTGDGGAGIQFSNSDFSSNLFQLFLANDGTGLKIGRANLGDYVTFLNGGNVGIGATLPQAKLVIQGNVGIGYTGVNQSIPSNGLAVSGNVGIGITTANSTLSVAGNVHIGGIRQGISAPTDGLFVDGNVGIGATTSSNLLDVWGNARITGTLTVDGSTTSQGVYLAPDGSASAPAYSFSADTNSGLYRFASDGIALITGGASSNLLSLNSSGNVGVGTTSPLQALHVVGQCVTGDTKLRRRKRKKNGAWSDEYEDVEIKDIKEGAQILSLNESSGKFEPHQVKGLMDMGKQEVFLLTTQSNLRIETTANHPYLTIEKGIKNKQAKITTTYEIDQSPRIEDLTKDSFVALANIQNRFAIKLARNVKRQIFTGHYKQGRKLFGPQIFAYLIVEAINESNFDISKLFIDKEYVGYQREISQIIEQFYPQISIEFKSIGHINSPAHRLAYDLFTNKKRPGSARISKDSRLQDSFTPGLTQKIHYPHDLLITKSYHKFEGLSSAAWKQVQYLKPGDIIATIKGWQKISSIYSRGRKQTYDIEIDYTHNFVGNNIVAHNTYITGVQQSGDGTASSPAYSFTADTDNGMFRPSTNALGFSTGGSSRMTITAAGNVGIGNTNPSALLELTGNLLFTNEVARTISVADSTTSNTAGAQLNITGAAGASAGAGTANGGAIVITAGAGKTGGAGAGGALTLAGGAAQSGNSAGGAVSIAGGRSFGNGIPGTVTITGGQGSVAGSAGGNVTIAGGTGGDVAGISGALTLRSGTQGVGGADTGTVTLQTTNAISANSGALTISTGTTTNSGTTGAISITTGNSAGNSGNITLTTGSSSSTIGSIIFQTNGTTERARFDASGNLGIGTSIPLNRFQVNSTVSSPFVVTSGGNVGIANSAPSYALDVIGTTRFSTSITQAAGQFLAADGTASLPAYSFSADTNTGLYRFASDGIALITGGASSNLLSLNSSGNVGVGTTSPLQALHVVGQCVAKGTRIRRRRRGYGAQGEDEWLASRSLDEGWEEVPVEDIKPDDEILSLNDKQSLRPDGLKTGQWEWHKVEKTMDMGIQKVYELTTETGKKIETTANHPYLILEEALANKLKGNDYQNNKDQDQAKSYPHLDIPINYFLVSGNNFGSHIRNYTNFLNINAIANAAIPSNKLYTDGNILDLAFFATKGITTTAPNQPAERLTRRSDNVVTNFGSIFNSISQAKWTKVSQIKTGQYIATISGWEKVVSIAKIGRKQTYDLQIEGTHNFVGNDIVAHNTYITGVQQSGDGTASSPAYSFTGDTDNGMFRPSANALGFSTNGSSRLTLTEAGNVGIGNTNPSALLELTGNLLFTRETNRTISVQDSTTSNTAGANLTLSSAGGIGTGAGGALALTAGSGGATNASGGGITLTTGASSGTGIAGTLALAGGTGTGSGAGGAITLTGGGNTLTGAGGAITITTGAGGDTSGASGALTLATGATTSGAGGAISISVGSSTTTNNGSGITLTAGAGGPTNASGGGITLTGGTSSGTGTGGNISLVGGTGTGSGASGDIYIVGGSATGGGTVGDVLLAITSGATARGNVGIGTTGPGTTFAVVGNATIGYGNSATSPAGPSSGLGVSGNVGVGTTSPLQALHVVGQCVVGETKLKRRRRRKNSKGDWEEYLEEVEIKDIKEGDEILTLNEENGNFVVQKVKGLMDMGIQQTYLLITDTGKTIRTTANHPYLVRPNLTPLIIGGTFEVDQSPKLEQLNKDSFIALANNNIHYVIKVDRKLKRAINDLYRKEGRLMLFGPNILSHALATLVKKANLQPDRLEIDLEYPGFNHQVSQMLSFLLPNTTIHFKAVGQHSPAHFAAYGAYIGKIKVENEATLEDIYPKKKDRGAQRVGLGVLAHLDKSQTIRNTRDLMFGEYHKLEDLSTAKWVKVYDIRPGMVIATIDGWERIVSLKEYAREQTYDIEVDYTHNFVGNDIVAHNTYITGNVGIGTSTPTLPLMVVGGGEFRNTASSNDVIQLSANDTNIGLELRSGTSLGTPFIDFANDATTDFDGRIRLTGDDALLIEGADLNMGSNQVITNIGNAGTDFNTSGGLTLAAALAVNGGDITTTATTFNLVNATATTVNLAGAATAISIGAATGTTTINNQVDIVSDTAIRFLRESDSVLIGSITNRSSPNSIANIMTLGGAASGGGLADNDGTVMAYANTDQLRITTTTAPQLTHETDTDTGVYWAAADNLRLRTGGTDRITADSAGNIGIGTISPTNLLHISGGNVGIGVSSATSTLAVNGNSTIGWGLTGVAGPSSGLAVSGNVGIGTTSPTRILELARDLNPAGTNASLLGADGTQFAISGSTFAKKLVLGIDTTDNFGVIQAGNTDGTNYTLALNPAGGNVGIGTTTTSASLQVAGTQFNTGSTSGSPLAFVNDEANTNLVTNPSVETNTTGWGLGANWSRDSTRAYSGSWSLLKESTNTATATMTITTSASTTYTVSGWVYNALTSGNAYIDFNDIAEECDVQSTRGRNQWERISCTFTTAVGRTSVTMRLVVDSSPNGNVWFDGIQFEQKSYPTSYTDGSLGPGYSWSGTAHNSTSSRTAGFQYINPARNFMVDSSGNISAGSLLQLDGSGSEVGLLLGNSGTSGRRYELVSTNTSSAFGGGLFVIKDEATARLVINSSGNVGIGTTGPGATFAVVGNATIGFGNSSVTPAGPSSGLAVSGNVGIGITTANSALTVNGGVSVGSSFNITAPTNGMIVQGNVGIGFTTPAAQLHVVDPSFTGVPTGATIGLFGSTDGTTTGVSIRARGTITGALADFGEYFPFVGTRSDYEDGDLVGNITGEAVSKTTTPYDSNIRGVISPASSFAGGADDQTEYDEFGRPTNRLNVALLGRVPVKVSSENGPIEVGDFLTSSSIPGVAMKATRPGQVVGKALEAWNGEGGTQCPDQQKTTLSDGSLTVRTSDEVAPDLSSVNITQDSSNVNSQICGRILSFVNVSYADPGNFFASLSFDDSGNLIIPKIKTASIILDPSVASVSASLTPESGQLAMAEDPAYFSTAPPPTQSSQFYDLSGKIASIEDRIATLEKENTNQQARIDNLQEILGNVGIATSSASLTEASQSSVLSSQLSEASSSGDLTKTDNSLNLTPPDILLNTGSAVFTNLSVKSEATMSGQLTAYQAEIKDHFKVLGKTTLASTQIVGDLTVDGTLSIENGSEINVIGTLYLQKSYLAEGLDIFNGKVTIDKEGTLSTTTLIADQIKINEGKSAGVGKILAGQIEVVIENPYVEENSLVIITPHTPLIQTLGIIERKAKAQDTPASFKVQLAHPEPVDISFDYLIIGQEKKLTQAEGP